MYDDWEFAPPQDWPPGPIVPANDTYYGITGPKGAGTAVKPTPIGLQINLSPAAATQPPLNPAGTAGGVPTTGAGTKVIPPTLFPPV